MKKLLLKRIIAITMVMTTLLCLPTGVKAEWRKDNIGWWNTERNSWSTGWRNVNNLWYYFDSYGYMKTGWFNDNGIWYYLNSAGDMKTGWINDNGTWYFANNSGAMQTGLVKIDDKIYFLASNGAMLTGNVNINDKIYTFAISGEALDQTILNPINEFSKEGEVVQSEIKNQDKTKENDEHISNKVNSGKVKKGHHSSGSHNSNGNTKKYRVSFDTCGAGSIKDIFVDENSTIKLPNVKREGYILKGWYLDYDGIRFPEDMKVTSDIELHAEWYTDDSNLVTKIIDEVHLKVPTPVVGGTPKNISIIDDDNYFVIVNEWNEKKIGSSGVGKMPPYAKFKKGYKYFPTILLKSKDGYKFSSEFGWVNGENVIINGKRTMPNFIDKLSRKTIIQFELYSCEPIVSENIDTNIEINDRINFSLDKIDPNNDESKRYIQIIYKKDTLEPTSWCTGESNLQPNEEELFIEYNLENWYAMNNSSEYELIRDGGKVKLVKKYESPVTIYYNEETLEIREIELGIHNRWGMTVDSDEDIDKCDYNFIIVDATDYGTDKYDMRANKDNYAIVKYGDNIKLEEKKDDITTDDELNLKSEKTTTSAISL
ncbi:MULTISPECIES: InlB B-repeat-containing protein [unclassified Clostridium]|uniref:InlB B-repeat-containing protein n=1 Tax=unclassified Clostridium TaxID=2614128 RepID=UPI00207AB96A|nr:MULTISPECIES: InlB B-repeat-containing protein [unclassified Clostridium]